MAEPSADTPADLRDYGLAVFVTLLVVVAVLVVGGALWHREPDTALVLATRHDCLRAFDTKQCHAIVETALALHARTAPRFVERRTCELSFGTGACRDVTDGMGGGGRIYVPGVAVILASREGSADEASLLPLYYGPKREASPDGQRVYFHGIAAGVLSDVKFGGAEISRVVDLKGKAMTAAAVKKIRGR